MFQRGGLVQGRVTRTATRGVPARVGSQIGSTLVGERGRVSYQLDYNFAYAHFPNTSLVVVPLRWHSKESCAHVFTKQSHLSKKHSPKISDTRAYSPRRRLSRTGSSGAMPLQTFRHLGRFPYRPPETSLVRSWLRLIAKTVVVSISERARESSRGA